MTLALAHRGPDDFGFLRNERACLGHRRLSIIDLSAAGRQPLLNEDGTIAVICNGEIYNFAPLMRELAARGHRFASKSDTEVLVHGYEEWGIGGLLGRLEGMFAFALHDARAGRFVLARDRFGIKPLYYTLAAGDAALHFASEVRALRVAGLADGAADPMGIAGFLALGSVPSPRTALRGVACLEAGHYLDAGDNGWSLHRYWALGEKGPEPETDLATALRVSVERNLISDVPTGIFLSGGVDSTGLVALASASHHDLRTLTVVMGKEDAVARETAQLFHTQHAEVEWGEAAFPEIFDKYLAAMDQPTVDGLNTWLISRAAREAGLTVALSGTGGDEVFWGYPPYRKLQSMSACPSALGPLIAMAGTALGTLWGKEGWRRASWLREGITGQSMYGLFRGFFPLEDVRDLLGLSPAELAAVRQYPGTGVGSLTAQYNQIEFRRYLHDQLLRDTDVFSMAHGLEIRVPYLDTAVVNGAMRLPDNQKLAADINKPALVRAAGHARVAAVAREKKTGFHLPMERWMATHSGMLREMALRPSILDAGTVRRMWSAFEAGRLHWSRAMALVVLGAGAGR